MAVELVIFDCDGVLVDSEPVAARVLFEALTSLGIEETLAGVDRKYRGRSIPDIILSIEAEWGAPLPDTFVDELNAKTRAAFEAGLMPVPGVQDLLDDLTGRGIDLCVASSGAPEKIRHSLAITGLLPFFEDRLFSALMVERGKPAPDLFLHAAKMMGHRIESSVVIEDSVPGIAGAAASGARVLAFLSPDAPDLNQRTEHARSLGASPFHRMGEVPLLLPT